MNFSETSTVPVPKEFLAIILAGFGNELSPLTNNHGDNPCPKALLPVANRPMLSYILKWIEESGLKDVMVVSPTLHRKALSDFLSSDEANVSLSVSLEAYDADDESTGTMQVLSKIAPKIKTDFLILPCDFFPPPTLQLSSILREYRISTDNLVLNSLFYEYPASESSDELPGPSAPPDVLFDERTRSLIKVDYSEGSTEDLEFRMSICWKYPRTRLATRLVDSHIYVCKRGVLDLITERSAKEESFKEDFLPWLCQLQYQSGRRNRHSKVLASLTTSSSTNALTHSGSLNTSQHLDGQSSPNIEQDSETAQLRVGLTIHRSAQGQALRANNLLTYMEINRKMLSQSVQLGRVHPSEGIDAKAAISPDSLIGTSTRVGERTTIKKSIIGAHCVIGKMARITGSIVGDHCVIADGAKIDGSIIAHHSRIGEKAELVKCQTQAGYEVEAEEKAKSEKLQLANWAGQLDDDDDDDDEDEEEEEEDDE